MHGKWVRLVPMHSRGWVPHKHLHVFEGKKSMGVVFLHACARTDHSVSKIIIFKSAAGSISFRSTVSQSCSIHACVGGPRPRAGRASALRWRCRRLAAACPVRLVGDIRHATAVVHKVFGQENKPGAPVTSSQGARDTNVRPPNRAWEERSFFPLALLAALRGGRARVHEKEEVK